jgi:hypothetical protein
MRDHTGFRWKTWKEETTRETFTWMEYSIKMDLNAMKMYVMAPCLPLQLHVMLSQHSLVILLHFFAVYK